MDGLDRFLLAALGGGLLVYGFLRVGATKRENPFSSNPIEAMIEVPDDQKRTEGKLSLFIGAVFLLGAIFG